MESYFVIGADGSEYGPATLEQLVEWQKEGRIVDNTQVKAQSTGVVMPASQVLGGPVAPPTATPYNPGPVATPSTPAPYNSDPTASPSAPPAYNPGPMAAPSAPAAYNPGPMAAPSGAYKANTPAAQPYAAGTAPKRKTAVWVWVVLAVSFCMCLPIGAAIVLPIVAQAGLSAISVQSLADAKLVSTGLIYYAADKTTLPDFANASTLASGLQPYIKEARLVEKAGTYTYNTALSGKDPNLINNSGEVWLLKASDQGRPDQNAVCYVDGHCRLITPEQFVKAQSVAVQETSVEPPVKGADGGQDKGKSSRADL